MHHVYWHLLKEMHVYFLSKNYIIENDIKQKDYIVHDNIHYK